MNTLAKKISGRFLVLSTMIALCLARPAIVRADTNYIAITDLTNYLSGGGTIIITNSGTLTLAVPLAITNNTTIDGLGGTNVVIFSGAGVARVFSIHTNTVNPTLSVTLRNVQINSGKSTNGAGIYNSFGSTLTLISNIFNANTATNGAGRNGANGNSGDDGGNGANGGNSTGAAIYSLGDLVISNCNFTANTCQAGNGGNGGNGGSDTLFAGNGGNGGNGGTGAGGAIYCSGTSRIHNSSFSQNIAVSGSAGSGGSAGSAPFAANPGVGGIGGTSLGAAICAAGPLGVTNCLFWNNHITGAGNALGGAVYITSTPTSEASFENCTFFENDALAATAGFGGTAGGGAIASDRITSMRNCTLATNSVFAGSTNTVSGVGVGGNIYNQSGSFIILNTILAHATNQVNCAGTITDGGYNLSTDGTAQFVLTTSHANTNPLLDSTVKTNGGPTLTLALLLGSPAIDKIPTIFTNLYPVIDQRGISRPQGTNVDIGAFEFMPLYQINGHIRSGNAGVSGVPVTVTSPTNDIVQVTNVATTNVITYTNTLYTNSITASDTNGNFFVTNLPAGDYLVSPDTNGIILSPTNMLVTVGGTQGATNIYFELLSLQQSNYTDLVDFPTNSSPRGTLVINSTNSIIGTTYYGGSSNLGTVFQLSSNGTFTTLHSFDGAKGANPFAGVIQGFDGKCYGTTYSGGPSNLGTVFQLKFDGTYNVLGYFLGANGAQPYGGVVQTSNHLFYGTTSLGGTANEGTIYQVTTNAANPTNFTSTLTTLYSFTGGLDGGVPESTLVADTNGNLYGTTFSGGIGNVGTVFRFNTNGTFTTLYSFTGPDGANPAAPLTLGRDGFFYGTTTAGGVSNLGTIFQLAQDGSALNTMLYFTGTNLIVTNAALIQGMDGDFYATSYAGGTNNNLGGAFRFSGTNLLGGFSFSGTNASFFGSHPYAGFTQATNGTLYGITSDGGANNGGVLFRVGLPPVITTQPVDVMVDPTNVLKSNVVFSVTVQGSAPLSYQWLKNSTNLAKSTHLVGATNSSSLTIVKVAATDIGTYSLIISNAFGLVESAGAQLIIKNPPKIVTQPVSLLHQPIGSDVNFKINVSGASTLTYQWFKYTTATSSNALSDTGNISGSSTTNLTVGSITTNDAGSYSVFVANGFGTTNSVRVVLTTIADVTKPTILISSPALNVRTDFPFLIGSASDNIRIAAVNYWITNIINTNIVSTQIINQVTRPAGVNTAKLDDGVKVRNWIIITNLLPGTNILAVQAVDFSGQTSAVVSRPFFYKVPAQLTLITTNTGGGTFTGTAGIAGDSVPARGATLNIGERYTITAIPDTNSFFTNWSGPFGTTSSPTITFTMQSNTTFTANFITNLFIGKAGIYNGLFCSNDLATATLETSGLISGLITTAKGAYSGRLLMGTAAYALAGNFSTGGSSTNLIARAAAQGGRLTVLLNNDWAANPRQISGSVSGTNNGGWNVPLLLVAGPGGTNVQPSLEYTMLMPPATNAPDLSPGGTGYALITNKAGTLILTVKMTDAAAVFTQTIPLSESKSVPFYASLYNNTGALLGWVNFDGGTYGDQIPLGTLAWIKKSSRNSLLYTNGFTNFISLQGSTWVNPGKGALTLPFTTNTPGVLELSGGDLALAQSNHVILNANNILAKAPASTNTLTDSTNTLTGSIDPKTGLVTITFGNGNGKATTVAQGAVLQFTNIAAGSFLGKTNSGSMSLHP